MRRSPLRNIFILGSGVFVSCLIAVGVLAFDLPPPNFIGLIQSQFEFPPAKIIVVTALSILGILSIFTTLQSIFPFIPPENSLWFRFYRAFRTKFPNSLITWLYQHPIPGIFVGSLAASIIVERFSSNLIVPVTAFYASTLFFQQVFSQDYTKLVIDPGHGTPDSVPDYIDHIQSEEARVLTIDVSNEEGREASLQIDYQVFDQYGYPITEWREVHQSEFDKRNIQKGESCDGIGLYLWEVSDDEPEDYITLVRASDKKLGRLFSTFSISSHSKND